MRSNLTQIPLPEPKRDPELLPRAQLSKSDQEWLVVLKQHVDRNIGAMHPYLFRMADKIQEIHRNAPITGVLVDDVSARFIGRFLHLTLRALGPLPIEYYKMSDQLKYQWRESREVAAQQATKWEKLGKHPLFVTELLGEGRTAMRICAMFKSRNISPVVATLADEGQNLNTKSAIRKAGAESVFCADKWGNLDLHVSYSNALNGVVYQNARIIPWRQKITNTGPSPLVRQLAVSHGRERLYELFHAYQDPARERGEPSLLNRMSEFFTGVFGKKHGAWTRTPFHDPTSHFG